MREESAAKAASLSAGATNFFLPRAARIFVRDLYTMYPACVDSRVSGGYIRVTLAYRLS